MITGLEKLKYTVIIEIKKNRFFLIVQEIGSQKRQIRGLKHNIFLVKKKDTLSDKKLKCAHAYNDILRIFVA